MKPLFIPLAAILLFCGCGRIVARGSRVGTIIKCADEGFFIKTHEIEIVRGGMNGGSGGFGVKPFFATITDEGEWQIAERYFNSQQEVEVFYEEALFTPFSSECDGEDEYCAFVTDIKRNQ